MLICQPITSVSALSDTASGVIIDRCTTIKDDLVSLQKADSRARVYLGGYFETIISEYVIPLNVRLVENNLSTADFIENQNQLTTAKTTFTTDFVDYQRELETLVGIDCKATPSDFYDQLVKVRTKRAEVASDVAKVRSLISDHTKAITALKEDI